MTLAEVNDFLERTSRILDGSELEVSELSELYSELRAVIDSVVNQWQGTDQSKRKALQALQVCLEKMRIKVELQQKGVADQLAVLKNQKTSAAAYQAVQDQ